MCGSNGPPGRAYFADAVLVNCGYVDAGRIPLVAMNDALWSWLPALDPPPNDHVRPVNGLPLPRTSKVLPLLSVPAPSL